MKRPRIPRNGRAPRRRHRARGRNRRDRRARIKQTTLDRIAIMTLNFQTAAETSRFAAGARADARAVRCAEMIADKYGVHKIEFQHYHIPSTEPAFLRGAPRAESKSANRG
jgi:hypothetical protein